MVVDRMKGERARSKVNYSPSVEALSVFRV
uniref:Uncharacterized protein n=1 Tax=Arundo donax TaxID=35708 RepID=A0A0A9GA81_ARUDO